MKIGHSMGAFISSAYILRYPKKIEVLILVEPWGYEDIKEEMILGLKKCSWREIMGEIFAWNHYFRFIGLAISPYSYCSIFRMVGEKLAMKILSVVRASFGRYYEPLFHKNGGKDLLYRHLYQINSCKYNT